VVPVKRTLVLLEYRTYPIAASRIKGTVQSHFMAHLNPNLKLFMIVSFRDCRSTLQEISLFKGAQAVQSLLSPFRAEELDD
jgi:hypothetical protein